MYGFKFDVWPLPPLPPLPRVRGKVGVGLLSELRLGLGVGNRSLNSTRLPGRNGMVMIRIVG